MTAATKVAGRYVLGEPLGRGGMGAVWRARDEVLKRDIALKEVEIPHSLAGEEGENVHERVLREARAAARLSHPSATTVYDVFQDNGRTFIAMELVDGQSLGEIVTEHGPLEPNEVARIGLALLEALTAAHDSGMVHRDVKPDNVMVTDSGQVKLTDFGIASVKGDPRLTMSGIILGSPSYMAPEQAEGKGAGKEADLWALGATLFFAVEGHAPFKKDSAIGTLASVVSDPTPSPVRAGPLADIITRLLAKNPTERPSAETVHRDLESAASGTPTPTGTATQVLSHDTTQVQEPRTEVRAAPTPAPVPPARTTRSKSRAPMWILGLLALALIGVVAYALTQRDDSSPNDRAAGGGSNQQQNGNEDETDEGTEPEPPVTQEGWTPYTISDTGYQISYPEDWAVSEGSNTVTFSDPESASSMLIEWTYSPGDDAVAAWRAQADSFALDHENYQEITIEPTTIEGFDTSAIWEFTYESEGFPIHAIDIGMAADDIGFAQFFQTGVDTWEAEQDTLQQFRDSFGPAE